MCFSLLLFPTIYTWLLLSLSQLHTFVVDSVASPRLCEFKSRLASLQRWTHTHTYKKTRILQCLKGAFDNCERRTAHRHVPTQRHACTQTLTHWQSAQECKSRCSYSTNTTNKRTCAIKKEGAIRGEKGGVQRIISWFHISLFKHKNAHSCFACLVNATAHIS